MVASFPAPLPPAAVALAAIERCRHCGSFTAGSGIEGFCCEGCRAVHRLLREGGLERFYELQGERGQPAVSQGEHRDRMWIELMTAGAASGWVRQRLDVQGLHCAGCVWLIETLFRRQAGAASIVVNPAVGAIDLTAEAGFDLRGFVDDVESFGYLVGPARKRERSTDLVTRMGVCIALAMNAMIFAISIYAGLREGPIFHLFNWLTFGLATLSVAVGGSVFIRSTWVGLRQRVLHLDAPIALGIVLAFTGSVYSLLTQSGRASYFDTLTVFIALMLVGRFLRERVVEQSRTQLLDTAGIDGLLSRVVGDGNVEVVPVTQLVEGSELLVGPGDLVPVRARLLDESAWLSFDWTTGESAPRLVRSGEVVDAGACLAGASPVRMRAEEPFEASNLLELLRGTDGTAKTIRFWDILARTYVLGVLVAAAIGFGLWMLLTHDVARALEVVVAVLVVTCPCAFGIATPLAYEIVQARLRREGLLVRSGTFLDRAAAVRRVVFDKTGTLTTGRLTLDDQSVLDGVTNDEQNTLYNLAARSTHPKSLAVKRALGGRGRRFDAASPPVLECEHGLTMVRGGVEYRLGSPRWAAGLDGADRPAPAGDVSFTADGELRAMFRTREDLRRDAASEVRALQKDGYDVWLLSGDRQDRVEAAARDVGVSDEKALGARTPRDKEQWVDACDDGDTLMIGDGINDSLASARAYCSGTPAADRPLVASRTDFYLVTPGLAPVRRALSAAKKLARVIRRNLLGAIAVNALGVGLCYAGLMSPLLAAVFMPAASLAVIGATILSLGRKESLWKS